MYNENCKLKKKKKCFWTADITWSLLMCMYRSMYVSIFNWYCFVPMAPENRELKCSNLPCLCLPFSFTFLEYKYSSQRFVGFFLKSRRSYKFVYVFVIVFIVSFIVVVVVVIIVKSVVYINLVFGVSLLFLHFFHCFFFLFWV